MQVLRPRATLFGGFEGRGQWGLAFRARNDLLFCWVEQGECLVLKDGCLPVALGAGDFLLIGTSTPFRLASNISAASVDSEEAVRRSHGKRLRLGAGEAAVVSAHAGKFVVSKANANLLDGLLPQLVRISAEDPSLERIRKLLAMNRAESLAPGPASEFVINRLVELILIEILRNALNDADANLRGVLSGLADRHTQKAIAAMHGDVARAWTVAELARLCGASRASFSAKFKRVLGVGPIEYLQRWRIALAKDKLDKGAMTVSEIAFSLGFGSSSAFSTAFKRMVGCSPARYKADAEPPPVGRI
ncbi:AraC family transcriptional regulator [Rhizobium laguerreae]|nr:AraC family transcriptional regulator [Rhizobium laguerreae]